MKSIFSRLVAGLVALSFLVTPAPAFQLGDLGSKGGFGSGGRVAPPTTGLRGDIWGDFTTQPNGTPTVAGSGEPYVRQPAVTGVTLATVSNGALVAPDSGQSSTAAYTFVATYEDIKSFYVTASFADANDVASINATIGTAQAAIGAACAHMIFTYNSWAVQYFSGATGSPVVTTVASGNFPAVAFGQKVNLGWRIDGSDIYIRVPDGSEVKVTSPETTSRTGHVIVLEQYRPATGTPGTRFYNWAANRFANPVAAGRTNLLAAQNNLANAAWTKAMSGPTSGQPDASGGTLGEQMLEQAANQFQWVFQPVSKAAAKVRYSHRARVKLIGRDWADLIVKNGAFSDLSARYYNQTTKALGSVSGSATDSYGTIISMGNGYVQIQSEFFSDTDPQLYVAFGPGNADGANAAGYTGDPSKGLIIYDEWLFARPN